MKPLDKMRNEENLSEHTDAAGREKSFSVREKLKHMALGLSSVFKALFFKPQDAAVGILVHGQELYAVWVTFEGNVVLHHFHKEKHDTGVFGHERGDAAAKEQKLTRNVRKAVVRRIVSVELAQSEKESSLFSLAESVEVLLIRNGWKDLPVGMAMGADMTQFYDIPVPLEIKEWKEAAYWELDERLLGDGLSAETSELVFNRDSSGICHVAAIDRTYFALLRDAFRETGRRIDSFSAFYPRGLSETEDGIVAGEDMLSFSFREIGRTRDRQNLIGEFAPAAAAALCAVGRGKSLGMDFLPKKAKRFLLRYKELSAMLLALVLVILIGFTTFDYYSCHAAKAERKEIEAHLVQMEGDRQSMQQMEASKERIDRKKAILAKLSENPSPVYSLLVHLGQPDLTVDGVWLETISFSGDGTLSLDGKAYSFDLLASFLKGFEKDTAFFSKPPILKESEETEDATGKFVRFKVEMSLQEE